MIPVVSRMLQRLPAWHSLPCLLQCSPRRRCIRLYCANKSSAKRHTQRHYKTATKHYTSWRRHSLMLSINTYKERPHMCLPTSPTKCKFYSDLLAKTETMPHDGQPTTPSVHLFRCSTLMDTSLALSNAPTFRRQQRSHARMPKRMH